MIDLKVITSKIQSIDRDPWMKKELAIGFDVGGTHIRGAIVSHDGCVLERFRRQTPTGGHPDLLIPILVDCTTVFRKQYDVLSGIGIGAPGPLRAGEGIVSHMPNLEGWRDFALQDTLSRETGLPVVLINDADAGAIGEHLAGAARDCPLFAYLTLGTGLGSAIVSRGKVWTGSRGFSNEWGHIPVFPDSGVCSCGHPGHAEAFLSTRFILNEYGLEAMGGSPAGISSPVTVSDVFDRDRTGDKVAAGIIDRYGSALGRLIATIAIALDVDWFILGGGISASCDRLMPLIMEAIRWWGFPPLTDGLTIRRGALGDDAGLIGAASLVMHRKIRDSSS
ncbi:ROK family protein [bacterium]|nr:ROK family protein [candidate division CSSED10-310 bacterium]